MTGQQRMLTPPWHLILPLLCPRSVFLYAQLRRCSFSIVINLTHGWLRHTIFRNRTAWLFKSQYLIIIFVWFVTDSTHNIVSCIPSFFFSNRGRQLSNKLMLPFFSSIVLKDSILQNRGLLQLILKQVTTPLCSKSPFSFKYFQHS
jgi:hypothetical protein